MPPKARKRPRDKRLKAIGDRIRAERETHKPAMSQLQLAERVGADRSYFSGVERGMRNYGVLLLFDIADALGVSPKKLLP